jgi:hypothetical protein
MVWRSSHHAHTVNEQDDLPGCLLDLTQDCLEAFFEFPPVFGASDESAHVQGPHTARCQALGHIAGNNALRKAFHDRSFACMKAQSSVLHHSSIHEQRA